MNNKTRLITIVGMGPASPDMLTVKAVNTLLGAECIVLRTKKHPVADWLTQNKKEYIALDYIYDTSDTFEELDQRICDKVVSISMESQVAGHSQLMYT